MIEINIPGRAPLRLEHLVCDVNGTLAKDGRLLDKLAKPLVGLKDRLTLHLITADTYGKQDNIDFTLGVKAVRLKGGDQAEQKAEYVRGLGAEHVVAIGNGVNDALMLKEAALGLAVLGEEGLAVETLLAADIVVASAYEAVGFLENPIRLVATLRR